MDSIFLHRVHNLCLAVLGILLNILLIFVVLKRTKTHFRLYARLVLFCAVYDCIYSFLEILCQHQLEIKNGYFFIMSYGIEQYVSQTVISFLGVAHLSLFLMAVTIIPTQFRYRYWLVNSASPSIYRLIGSFFISFGASTLLAILALFSHFECHKRGRDFYEKMLDKSWYDNNRKTHFIDAIDLNDTITKVYYGLGTLIIAGSYGIALCFGYKSLKVVQPLGESELAKGKKSLALRRQFTMNLIIQAVSAYFCSVTPTTWVALSTIFRLDVSGYGVWVYTIMAYIPTLNAALTLYIIQPYREYLKQLLGFAKKESPNLSTITRTENISAISSNRIESDS